MTQLFLLKRLDRISGAKKQNKSFLTLVLQPLQHVIKNRKVISNFFGPSGVAVGTKASLNTFALISFVVPKRRKNANRQAYESRIS